MTNSISFADTKVVGNRLIIERVGATFTLRWRNYCAWDESISQDLPHTTVGNLLLALFQSGWWSTDIEDVQISVGPDDTGGTIAIQHWAPAQHDAPVIARVASGDTGKLISWLKGQFDDACGRPSQ